MKGGEELEIERLEPPRLRKRISAVADFRLPIPNSLLLLLMLSTFVLIPLLAPGYFYNAHDGRHSVFYLAMFDASLADGALWPRWAMHHIQGYGYPTFVIQAPLGFYLGAFFARLGFGYTAAAKLVWVTAFYGSAWGMYALVRYLLTAGRESARRRTAAYAGAAGLVAGLVYVYAPYHLVDIFVRAALNDTLLLAWLPWTLLAFDRLIARGGAPGWGRRLAAAGLVLAGTLLTHAFALISFGPFLVAYVLFRLGLAWPRGDGWHTWPGLWARTGLAGAAGVGGLLLTSAFLLPLLVEGQHLQQQVYVTDTYDFRNHFVYFGQFFSPRWGFGFSDDPTGVNDGMSFQLGLLPLLFLMAGGIGLASSGARTQSSEPAAASESRPRAHCAFFAAATIGLLLLMLPLSAPLWENIGPLSVIQFPWRLLSLTILTASALAGLVTGALLQATEKQAGEQTGEQEEALAGALLLGVLAMLAVYPVLGAQLQPVEPWREDGRAVFRFEEEHPDMIAYTEWVEQPFTRTPMSDDYASPAYYDIRGRTDALTRIAIIQGEGEIVEQQSAGSSGGGTVRMTMPGVVRIHLFYFPGWQVFVDDEQVPYRVSPPDGVLEVDVPAGEHRIEARMGTTPVRTAGAAVSWGVLIMALVLLVWPVRRHTHAAVHTASGTGLYLVWKKRQVFTKATGVFLKHMQNNLF